jgi:hypothetical protein
VPASVHVRAGSTGELLVKVVSRQKELPSEQEVRQVAWAECELRQGDSGGSLAIARSHVAAPHPASNAKFQLPDNALLSRALISCRASKTIVQI